MPLISAIFRSNFRECCVSLVLRQIDDIFMSAGFRPNTTITITMSGERRGLVERYYANINWERAQDAERFLEVVSVLLSQSNVDDRVKEDVRRICSEEGLVVDGRHVRFGTQIGIPWFLSSSSSIDREQFGKHCQRIQTTVQSDPEGALGASKELVEAVARYIIQTHGDTVTVSDSVQAQLKKATGHLSLTADDIPEAAKGAEAIKKVLNALGTIVHGMAELRNLYGTGHGRPGNRQAVYPRHAKLAVGAAITLATFLLETQEERFRDKPAHTPSPAP